MPYVKFLLQKLGENSKYASSSLVRAGTLYSTGVNVLLASFTCLATKYILYSCCPNSSISGTFLKQVLAEQLPDTPWQIQ